LREPEQKAWCFGRGRSPYWESAIFFQTFSKERSFIMQMKQVSIQSITVKEEIQQRVSLNEECIKEYADEIANGAHFPPLVVFSDEEILYLADGIHRYAAYKLASVETVDVIVQEGGLRGAILHAVGANADHGLRRTNADKRKAVMTLLTDEEWGKWSDNEISKRCLVSQPFVSRVRAELTYNGYKWDSERLGADGRTIDTTNIGSKSGTVSEEVEEVSTPNVEVQVTILTPTLSVQDLSSISTRCSWVIRMS
jgi:hypothetical protein